jgi:signal peptidase I
MTWTSALSRDLRRPLLAFGCVFVAFLVAVMVLSAAVGIWPPFMAVESKSMQHSEDVSQLGVIDTGDVVVARRLSGPDDVQTYVGSIADGHRSYGEYGDVIVYERPEGGIPIVHRAICTLVYNGDGSFDIPELSKVPAHLWSTPSGEGRWWGLAESVYLYEVGYAQVTVHIDLAYLLSLMGPAPHGGLITMGDNNWVDQGHERLGLIDQGSIVAGPLEWKWVIGKITGEVPWIGSLKLWLTGTAPDYLPQNSIILLGTVVGAIVALPTTLWALASWFERRSERRGQDRSVR